MSLQSDPSLTQAQAFSPADTTTLLAHERLRSLIPNERLRALLCWGAVALGTIGAMFTLATATPQGVGLNADSYYYLTSADSLASGAGLGRAAADGTFKPLTHYPPLYPMAVAALESLSISTFPAARYMNIMCFGLLVLLASLCVRVATGSDWAAPVAAALLAGSPVLINVSSWAMSEPLFLALFVASLLLLDRAIRRTGVSLMFLAGLAVGFACLTRYVGFALLATGTAVVALTPAPARLKLKRLAAFLIPALTPVLIWSVRNYLLSGNPADRRVQLNALSLDQLSGLVNTLFGWFTPRLPLLPPQAERVAEVLGIVLVVFGYVAATAGRRSVEPSTSSPRVGMGGTAGLHSVAYIGLVLVSYWLVDKTIPLDDRMLSPVLVSLVILLLGMLSRIWAFAGRQETWLALVYRAGTIALLAVLVSTNLRSSAALVSTLEVEGQGYAAAWGTKSETLHAVRDLPAAPTFTNRLKDLYFYAHRNADMIPLRIDPSTNLPRPSYADELDAMRAQMSQGAYLVLLRTQNVFPNYASEQDLIKGLTRVGAFADGEIYRYVAGSSQP